MITSKLPPSRLLGSVGTDISCPAFTCFVSTARCLLVSARWETAVFEVSSKDKLDMRLRARFGYPGKMKAKGGALFHDIVCAELDKVGEGTHMPLSECLSIVIGKLRENHVIGWVKLARSSTVR